MTGFDEIHLKYCMKICSYTNINYNTDIRLRQFKYNRLKKKNYSLSIIKIPHFSL